MNAKNMSSDRPTAGQFPPSPPRPRSPRPSNRPLPSDESGINGEGAGECRGDDGEGGAGEEPIPNPQPASPLFPQVKGESDRAFEAFRVYLELGPQRRYAAVGRTVGASQRTIRRWALDFDWRGRIKNHVAHCAGQYTETETAVQREQFLDAAARAKTFRDRQYALAEAILDAAERYLERAQTDDLDQMCFADACKALEVASRLGQQAAGRETDDASAPARNLRDQLAALLDQVYGEDPSRTATAAQPQTVTPPKPKDESRG